MPHAQRASYEQTPLTARTGDSYLGGRASNPEAWLANETPRQTKVATSCKTAGRAAQPFSGPSQHLLVASSDRGTKLTCRTTSTERF
jgi:hypothetical protein